MDWPVRDSLRALLGQLDPDQPLPPGFKPYVPPHTPAEPPALPIDALEQVAKDNQLYKYLDQRGLPVPPELPTWNRRGNFPSPRWGESEGRR